jgi:hypothetical protein
MAQENAHLQMLLRRVLNASKSHVNKAESAPQRVVPLKFEICLKKKKKHKRGTGSIGQAEGFASACVTAPVAASQPRLEPFMS